MKTNRREFFAAAGGLPALAKTVAPSDRIALATIGVGGMGTEHMQAFLKLPEAQVVAVCDVDEEHLAAAKQRVDRAYQNSDCATYRAFEEVLSRRDIDAITIAVPDHWHGVVAVSALRAGKDVYGEKPLAHNLQEGSQIVAAVKRYNRIWQTGSWQRSRPQFQKACELVRNGRLGKIHTVEVGLPGGPDDYGKYKDQTEFTDPPPTFNYDRWTGPAAEAPYCGARCHWNWRWNLNYGGGQLMDWVGHHVDIAHWGLGFDESGPYEIQGVGEYPPSTELWNSAKKYRITAKYAGGITMIIAGGYKEIKGGTKWIGEKGWIHVDRRTVTAEPADLLKSEIGESEIHLTKSDNHYRQFLECVKSRQETLTPARIAHRSATPGWLGQIAMLTGRKIRWDPVEQRIKNDARAEKMLARDMRIPWRL